MSKGGKRLGAGRPLAAPSAVMRIRLPLPVHAQVVILGGDWDRVDYLGECLDADREALNKMKDAA